MSARRLTVLLTEPQYNALHAAYLLQRETWVADEVPEGTVSRMTVMALDNAWSRLSRAWDDRRTPAARHE